MPVPRTLVVTNDFPPRVGGVQQYVWNLVRHLPSDRVAVLAPNWPGWRDHDAAQDFPIHRWPPRVLWPTPDLARRVRQLARHHDSDIVLFGHGFPLPILGPSLAREGVPYAVLTHGAEVWLARSPIVSLAMGRSWSKARVVTAVSRCTARTVRRALPPGALIHVLHPGVDPGRFSARQDVAELRRKHRLDNRSTVLCVSRLVPRKGQDVLIRSLSFVRQLGLDVTVVLVGDGPYRTALEALASTVPQGSVVFTGAVGDDELPAYYAACDVFAMPCRSRWGGLEVEGFGIVFLEAAASSKPAVAGRSGGAEEAVVDGRTGLLVEGAEPKAVALALVKLLDDRSLAVRLGSEGRARVEAEFTWARQAARLAELLEDAAG